MASNNTSTPHTTTATAHATTTLPRATATRHSDASADDNALRSFAEQSATATTTPTREHVDDAPLAADARAGREQEDYDGDDFVTVLLIHAYRAILDGRERRNQTVFFGAEGHGVVTFRGGFARDVPYAVAAQWRKLPQYRNALKIVPNDTPESAFAAKIGLQPRHAAVLASEMEATGDLASVVQQMTPEMRAKLRRLLENS